MVSLEQIRASNARIPECLPAGMVVVFAGGTSGIGETTMRQFAKHAVQPRIYFVGRSEKAAARLTAELTTLNPAGKYRFIKADLSLLQNVDDVCREIKTEESRINLLFLTTGTLITGRDTAEGLYYPTAVTYYARIRFIVNLLPLLQKATGLRRVVTVFGGTKEGTLYAGDLQGRSLAGAGGGGAAGAALRAHTSSMMTLALESLAFEAPDVAFVHSFPGIVRTNLGRDLRGSAGGAAGLVRSALRAVVSPMISVPLAEAGERQLFLATSARFPARCGVDVATTAGVPRAPGVGVARGSDARDGSGVYSVSFDGEPQEEKVEEAVQKLRDGDLVRRLWLYTVGEFLRVTGSEFV
ncbi:19460085-89d4-48b6-a52a-c20ba3e10e4d [Thermothielavioides terrestris]|uniref:19460085-89d4-48b6-a52a-c20ba3e10e4d n=1 Tax=Thermothielavioides terrestris TaxID=2587410 RepID=A0A446BNF8_9PEZI|nr:19460085-89d4-48b6-a52a-c20ba3e10e4d [Thermothielavioides terrestris]